MIRRFLDFEATGYAILVTGTLISARVPLIVLCPACAAVCIVTYCSMRMNCSLILRSTTLDRTQFAVRYFVQGAGVLLALGSILAGATVAQQQLQSAEEFSISFSALKPTVLGAMAFMCFGLAVRTAAAGASEIVHRIRGLRFSVHSGSNVGRNVRDYARRLPSRVVNSRFTRKRSRETATHLRHLDAERIVIDANSITSI